jgi:hypothetical protein
MLRSGLEDLAPSGVSLSGRVRPVASASTPTAGTELLTSEHRNSATAGERTRAKTFCERKYQLRGSWHEQGKLEPQIQPWSHQERLGGRDPPRRRGRRYDHDGGQRSNGGRAADRAGSTAAASGPPLQKQTVKITWRDPYNHNRYLQIKNDSKKNGARANTAKRNRSTDQEWYAHLTCEFSASGLDLWSFKNVHSSLCLALGTSGHPYVEPDAVQHFCGRHFTRRTFTESPQYSFRNGHRHFLGWVLNLLSAGKKNLSGLALCDSPKFGPYFSPWTAVQAGGGCEWR